MDKLKDKDFVEIEYTGKIKDSDEVFDTTHEDVAKANGLDDKTAYKPIIICIGQGFLLKGLEDKVIGKEIGKEYSIDLSPEEGFGKKDARLIQLVPTKKFLEQKINPVPGLQVNIDGTTATIKTASGGRCMVDFNHPLAGKSLSYSIKLNRLIDSPKEKLSSILELNLGIIPESIDISEKKASITIGVDLPKELLEPLKKKMLELVNDVTDLKFTIKKKEK